MTDTLGNEPISGLCIMQTVAGLCLLSMPSVHPCTAMEFINIGMCACIAHLLWQQATPLQAEFLSVSVAQELW